MSYVEALDKTLALVEDYYDTYSDLDTEKNIAYRHMYESMEILLNSLQNFAKDKDAE